MKVFLLGTNQLNFIYLLARSIRKINPAIEFASFRLNPLGGKLPHDLSSVIHTTYSSTFNLLYFSLAFLRSLGDAMFWRTVLFILFREIKPGKALHFVYHWNLERSFFIRNDLRQYEVFHFHFIQYSYLRSVWFVPPTSRIICTFWGSDLLRTHDPFNHFFVSKALSRADFITTQSVELQELILSRYGQQLKPKIRVRKLSLDTSIFDKIDAAGTREAAKASMSISADKLVVVVGHNANPFNNHMAVIEALGSLSMREKLHVIVPFAYAADRPGYDEELGKAAARLQLKLHFIKEYLESDSVAAVRVITDIMIHVPSTDALSGAATECMYAGNLLVTGAWLPYGPFKEAGLYYRVTDSLENLSVVIEQAISNLESERQKCRVNKEAIRRHFFPEVTAPPWAELYQEPSSK